MTNPPTAVDPFSARGTFSTSAGTLGIFRIRQLEDAGLTQVDRLPYSIRILLESVLRNCDGFAVTEDHVRTVANWSPQSVSAAEVPFHPARRVAGFYGGARRRRPGGHAIRHAAVGW